MAFYDKFLLHNFAEFQKMQIRIEERVVGGCKWQCTNVSYKYLNY